MPQLPGEWLRRLQLHGRMPSVPAQASDTRDEIVLAMMRTPRDIWTQEERTAIEEKALANMDLFARMGEYVSYETCCDLAQLGYMRRKLDEIEKWLEYTRGK